MKRGNRTHALILVILVAIAFGSCGRELTDAELLQRDKTDLADRLNSNKVFSYKFCKLIIRSASLPEDKDPTTQKFQSKATPLFARIMKIDRDNQTSLGVMDYIGLYQDYLTLKDFVIETDEDTFPTVLEALNLSYNADSAGRHLRFSHEEKMLYQNCEHAALSQLVLLSKDLGLSIALYECAETEPQFLPDGEAKTALQFYRGFIFFQAGFYYLSEEALTTNIDWLTAHSQQQLPFLQQTLHLDKPGTLKALVGFRGFNYLLRGFDRLMMDRDIDHERGLDDFEHFIADAKQIGLENELVWVVEAYLYMKREEHEKAIASLEKLKDSKLLSEKEKAAIDETISYLKDREPDKALNKVYDNVFMGKIIVTYMVAQLSEIDWKKLLQENDIPYAEESFATMDRLQTTIRSIDQYTNTDTIAAVGKEVGKKVVEGVEQESKGLWERVKEWWEE